MPLIPFARQSKASTEALGYSGERLVNWFLRPVDSGLTSGALMGRSGLVELASGIGTARACASFQGTLFVVAGDGVWKYASGTATRVGTVAATGPATMATSATELAIVAGGTYYICDGTTTTQYSTGAVTAPVGVAYQDGYFIVAGSSGGRSDAITVSGLDDGTTFNALDFAFAEASPDGLVGIIADHGELWLFGTESVEIFYNSGDPDFPFQRNQGALIERGCLAGSTVAKEDNAVFWVGPDRVAYRSNGSVPEVISTREVEEVLLGATIDGGFTFTDRGHKFYAIRCAGRPTLCYDMTTGLWCERASGIDLDPWLCSCSAWAAGVEYFATTDGRIVTQSASAYTDAGAAFRSEAVSVPVERGGEFFTVSKLHLNMAMGLVDRSGLTPADPPEIALQVSKDGRTWGPERWRQIGGLGEYSRRLTWHGLGTFRRAQFRLWCTEPVARDLYGVAYA